MGSIAGHSVELKGEFLSCHSLEGPAAVDEHVAAVGVELSGRRSPVPRRDQGTGDQKTI